MLGYSVEMRQPAGYLLRLVDAALVGDRQHYLHRSADALLVVRHIHDGDHVAVRLPHPVQAGDPQVEVALLHVAADLLRAQDLHVADTRIPDGHVILSLAAPLHRQVRLLEEEQRLLL